MINKTLKTKTRKRKMKAKYFNYLSGSCPEAEFDIKTIMANSGLRENIKSSISYYADKNDQMQWVITIEREAAEKLLGLEEEAHWEYKEENRKKNKG